MNILNQAIQFATTAYGDICRKGDGMPLILHAMEAAAIAATLTDDLEVMAAAVLHDTIEDCKTAPAEIRARFGDRIARLVDVDTEDKMPGVPPDQSWRARKEATIAALGRAEDPAAGMVVLSDKVANLRSLYREYRKSGSAIWQRFNQKDPEAHHWYYRAIADAIGALRDTAAGQEYEWLIQRVFECNSITKGEQGIC